MWVSAALKGAQISVWQHRTARTPNAVTGKGKGRKVREVNGRQFAVTSRKENAISCNSEVIGVAESRVSKTLRLLRVEGAGVKTVMLAKCLPVQNWNLRGGVCHYTTAPPWRELMAVTPGKLQKLQENSTWSLIGNMAQCKVLV